MHILYRVNLKMKVTEKIENAKKRINELEELIEYWNKSKKVENIHFSKKSKVELTSFAS
tara:strand:+ start:329 stop:505 length:177 start_codon:yes stop_codon:yes gene_type:complete